VIGGPLVDKYEDYHLRNCKVMWFRIMTQKVDYFVHMTLLWQMEFNSFLFYFCKAHYDYNIYRNWKVDGLFHKFNVRRF